MWSMQIETTGPRRVLVAQRAESVRQEDGRLVLVLAVAGVDQLRERLLVERLVDELERKPLGENFRDEAATHGGVHHDALAMFGIDHANPDARVQRDFAVVVGHPHFVEGTRTRREGTLRSLPGLRDRERSLTVAALRELALTRRVVETENDVLRRVDDGLAVRRREDVVRAHHEHAGFHLRLDRKRHVDGHLVTVEVGVERRANERVKLNGLAFDEHRLERLNAETVERRRAVQKNRVLADDFLENVEDLGALLLHHLLRRLDGVDVAALFELVVDERLEQLERHLGR